MLRTLGQYQLGPPARLAQPGKSVYLTSRGPLVQIQERVPSLVRLTDKPFGFEPKIARSNRAQGTKVPYKVGHIYKPEWWNGIHSCLRSSRPCGMHVQVVSPVPSSIGEMANAVGLNPTVFGLTSSTLVSSTIRKVTSPGGEHCLENSWT